MNPPPRVDTAKVLIAGLFALLVGVLAFWAYNTLHGFDFDGCMTMAVTCAGMIGIPCLMLALEWNREVRRA